MNQVLVTGGTGNLGKWVVSYLLENNYPVSVLSSKKEISSQNGISHVQGDLAANIGLNHAAHADIIIHCASDPRNIKQVDIEGTKHLLQSIDRKRIRHFLYISIVGVDKSSYPYYQGKYAVEKMIAGSGIPFTILRTTQFHSFILNMVQSFMNEKSNDLVRIPAGMRFQSVDIREVAKTLVEGIENEKGLLPEFGGPEILSFEDMVEKYLNLTKIQCNMQPVNMEGERYDLFRSGVNLCAENNFGKKSWQSFLEEILNAE